MTQDDVNQKIELLNHCWGVLSNQYSDMTPEDANRTIIEFQNDPNSYTMTQAILESQSYVNIKYTVLQSLKTHIEKNWKVTEEEEKNSICTFLINCIFDPNINLDECLVQGMFSCINEILTKDYLTKTDFFHELWSLVHSDESSETFRLARMFDLNKSFLDYMSAQTGSEDDMSYMYRRVDGQFHKMSKQFAQTDFEKLYENLQIILNSESQDTTLIHKALNSLLAALKCNKFISEHIDLLQLYNQIDQTFKGKLELAATSISIINEIMKSFVSLSNTDPQSSMQILSIILRNYDAIQELPDANKQEVIVGFMNVIYMLLVLDSIIGNTLIDSDEFSVAIQHAIDITQTIEDEDNFEECLDFWKEFVTQTKTRMFTLGLDVSRSIDFIGSFCGILINKMTDPLKFQEKYDNYNFKEIKIIKDENFIQMMDVMKEIFEFDSNIVFTTLQEFVINIQNVDDFNHYCWAVVSIADSDIPINLKHEKFIEILQLMEGYLGNEQMSPEDMQQVCIATTIIIHSYSKLFGYKDNGQYVFFEDTFVPCFSALMNFLQRGDERLALFVLMAISEIQDKLLFTQPFGDGKSALEILVDFFSEVFESEGWIDHLSLLVKCISRPLEKLVNDSKGIEFIKELRDRLLIRFGAATANLSEDPATWTYYVNSIRMIDSYVMSFADFYKESIPVASLLEKLQQFGEIARNTNEFRIQALGVKAAILNHLRYFISYIDNPETEIMALLSRDTILAILADYVNTPEDYCIPQTIGFLSTLIVRMQTESMDLMNDIMGAIFNKTKIMICSDTQKYTDIANDFFIFLDRIVMTIPMYIDQLSADQVSEIYEVFKIGSENPMSDVSETCLRFLKNFIDYMQNSSSPLIKELFFSTICIDVVLFSFYLLLDGIHKFTLERLSDLLRIVLKSSVFGNQERVETLAQAIIEKFEQHGSDIVETVNSIVSIDALGKNANKNTIEILKDFLRKSNEISPFNPEYQNALLERRLENMKRVLRRSNTNYFQNSADFMDRNPEEPPDSQTNDLLERLQSLEIGK